jgi:transposase InsO family protein
MALGMRQPERGLVHHSDRGCQYAGEVYRAELAARGIVCSMSRVGDCWDNAVAESFFATLKTELIHRRPWPTNAQAKAAVHDYIGRSSIRTGVTRPSVTSARWTSNDNTLPQPWQHSGAVYENGSTPLSASAH